MLPTRRGEAPYCGNTAPLSSSGTPGSGADAAAGSLAQRHGIRGRGSGITVRAARWSITQQPLAGSTVGGRLLLNERGNGGDTCSQFPIDIPQASDGKDPQPVIVINEQVKNCSQACLLIAAAGVYFPCHATRTNAGSSTRWRADRRTRAAAELGRPPVNPPYQYVIRVAERDRRLLCSHYWSCGRRPLAPALAAGRGPTAPTPPSSRQVGLCIPTTVMTSVVAPLPPLPGALAADLPGRGPLSRQRRGAPHQAPAAAAAAA